MSELMINPDAVIYVDLTKDQIVFLIGEITVSKQKAFEVAAMLERSREKRRGIKVVVE